MAGFTNDNDLREEILKELNAKFKTEDRGDLKWFLATAFERNISEGYVDLLQEKFASDLAVSLGYEKGKGRRALAPQRANEVLTKDMGGNISEAKAEDKEIIRDFDYRSKIGKLLYLVNCTRPDLTQTTKILAQFVTDPGIKHIEAFKYAVLLLLRGMIAVLLIR